MQANNSLTGKYYSSRIGVLEANGALQSLILDKKKHFGNLNLFY